MREIRLRELNRKTDIGLVIKNSSSELGIHLDIKRTAVNTPLLKPIVLKPLNFLKKRRPGRLFFRLSGEPSPIASVVSGSLK